MCKELCGIFQTPHLSAGLSLLNKSCCALEQGGTWIRPVEGTHCLCHPGCNAYLKVRPGPHFACPAPGTARHTVGTSLLKELVGVAGGCGEGVPAAGRRACGTPRVGVSRWIPLVETSWRPGSLRRDPHAAGQQPMALGRLCPFVYLRRWRLLGCVAERGVATEGLLSRKYGSVLCGKSRLNSEMEE